MVQKVKGEDFYEKMHLEHDAAARVMNQISSYVKENGLHDFSHFKANHTKLDKYYREEAAKFLGTVLDTLMGICKM